MKKYKVLLLLFVIGINIQASWNEFDGSRENKKNEFQKNFNMILEKIYRSYYNFGLIQEKKEVDSFRILERKVEVIQMQVTEGKSEWYEKPSILISLVALIFSLGTTGVSYYKTYKDDVRENKKEARELIQRMTKLPMGNLEVIKKYENASEVSMISSLMNTENVLLATQLVDFIKRYPNSFSGVEYSTTAEFLARSNTAPYKYIAELFEKAVQKSRSSTEYAAATRAYAGYLFFQEDENKGRKYYEKALNVWKIFPEKNKVFILNMDIYTLENWSEVEVSRENYIEAVELLNL